MVHWRPRNAVDEDAGATRSEKNANPLSSAMPRAQVTHSLEEKGLGYGVKSARNVEIEHDVRVHEVVRLSHGLLGKQKVVVNAPSGDEGTLIRGDHVTKARRKTEREHLREQLGHQMKQADRMIIRDRASIRLLGEQREQRLVETFESAAIEGV